MEHAGNTKIQSKLYQKICIKPFFYCYLSHEQGVPFFFFLSVVDRLIKVQLVKVLLGFDHYKCVKMKRKVAGVSCFL